MGGRLKLMGSYLNFFILQKPYKQRTSLEEKYQEALTVKKKQEELMETMDQHELASVPINEVIVKSELIINEEDDVVMNILPSALEANENFMHSPFQEQINAIKTEANLITETPQTDSYQVSQKSVGVQTPKMFLKQKKQLEPQKKSKFPFEYNPIQRFEQSLEHERSKCLFYTGLEFVKVKLLLSFLSPVCNNLIYCNSDKRNFNINNAEERRFTPRQELIITLTYLRCALSLQDLAYRFETSLELVTTIIITWVQLMYLEFSKHVKPRMFVTRHKIKEDMPLLFKEFKNLRVIIMCVEVYCQSRPLFNFEHHDHTYAKNQTSAIYKALIGCTPTGMISFVSPVYEGTTSNREMFIKSRIANLLEPDDLVLVDHELVIKDIIESKGGQLKIPPFMEICNDFEKAVTKKQRACVEEAVGRVKGFRVLQTELPLDMKGITSQLVFVCACIVNMNLS